VAISRALAYIAQCLNRDGVLTNDFAISAPKKELSRVKRARQ
jgi:hypothetical protein